VSFTYAVAAALTAAWASSILEQPACAPIHGASQLGLQFAGDAAVHLICLLRALVLLQLQRLRRDQRAKCGKLSHSARRRSRLW